MAATIFHHQGRQLSLLHCHIFALFLLHILLLHRVCIHLVAFRVMGVPRPALPLPSSLLSMLMLISSILVWVILGVRVTHFAHAAAVSAPSSIIPTVCLIWLISMGLRFANGLAVVWWTVVAIAVSIAFFTMVALLFCGLAGLVKRVVAKRGGATSTLAHYSLLLHFMLLLIVIWLLHHHLLWLARGLQLLFAMRLLLEVDDIDFLELMISVLMASHLVLESIITIRIIFWLLEVMASLLLILMVHNKCVFLVPSSTFPFFRRMTHITGVVLISCLSRDILLFLFFNFTIAPIKTSIRLFIIDRRSTRVSRPRGLLILLMLLINHLSLMVASYSIVLLVVNDMVPTRAARAWLHNLCILLLVDEDIAYFSFVSAHDFSCVFCQEDIIVTSIYVHWICSCSELAWPLLQAGVFTFETIHPLVLQPLLVYLWIHLTVYYYHIIVLILSNILHSASIDLVVSIVDLIEIEWW